MKIVIYSTYHFLLEPSTCPPIPLLINQIFSLKSKIKHTDVDTICFFSRYKIFTNKTKSFYWKHLMEPVKHLKWNFLEKKLTFIAESNFRKKKMLERYLNNTNSYFNESYSFQLLTHPLNLIIWCKMPVHSLITVSSTLQLSYGE